MHVFLHFKSFGLVVLQLILASKLSELEQFENFVANNQFRKQKGVKNDTESNWCHCQAIEKVFIRAPNFCYRLRLASANISASNDQLEKLEAAQAAWLVCLSLLSLTGSFLVLLGPSGSIFDLTGPYFAKLSLT